MPRFGFASPWASGGEFLETDPRGELLDRADLAGCLDIMGAAGASVQMEYIAARP